MHVCCVSFNKVSVVSLVFQHTFAYTNIFTRATLASAGKHSL